MDITELKKLIPYYVANTLDPDERWLVESELLHSEELRAELEFWSKASKAAKRYAQFADADHLSAETIVDYVEGNLRSNPQKEAAVDRHVRACADCREEIELIRNTYPASEPASQTIRPVQPSFASTMLAWIRRIRVAYAIPAVAILILVVYIVVSRIGGPTPEQPSTGTVAHLTLQYRPETRGTTRETPSVALNEAITSVRITVSLPHSGIEGITYAVALRSPSLLHKQLIERFTPSRLDASLDSISMIVGKDFFREGGGNYELTVTEILPTGHEDLTPETYTYRFRVIIK